MRASPYHLPEKLTRGQRHAAKQLLRSRDFLSLLVGGAGTDALQSKAAGRVLLIDEAGCCPQQLERLTAIAEKQHARLLLVSDTKQHYSVQRGDALRHIVEHTHTPVFHLAAVLRQREEPDRRLSRLLASGEMVEALVYADRQDMIAEAADDEALFTTAAERQG